MNPEMYDDSQIESQICVREVCKHPDIEHLADVQHVIASVYKAVPSALNPWGIQAKQLDMVVPAGNLRVEIGKVLAVQQPGWVLLDWVVRSEFPQECF